jgi:chromatin segregation and condensation protein Rec8/ScpA/Scc1 (kleisin family)
MVCLGNICINTLHKGAKDDDDDDDDDTNKPIHSLAARESVINASQMHKKQQKRIKMKHKTNRKTNSTHHNKQHTTQQTAHSTTNSTQHNKQHTAQQTAHSTTNSTQHNKQHTTQQHYISSALRYSNCIKVPVKHKLAINKSHCIASALVASVKPQSHCAEYGLNTKFVNPCPVWCTILIYIYIYIYGLMQAVCQIIVLF